MTVTDDRVSIGERYTSATESSNLRVVSHRRGDVDYLIALAWAPDTLGGLMFRLMHEFDGVRRQHQADIDAVRNGSVAAARLKIAAVAERAMEQFGPTLANKYDELSEAAKNETLHSAVSARAFIMAQLKSLDGARRKFWMFAKAEADRRREMISSADLQKLVGRVLDAWMDPLCPLCSGRGFNGGGRHEETGPQIICKPCRGTGGREHNVGRTEQEVAFAAHLLARISEQINCAEVSMRRKLSVSDD